MQNYNDKKIAAVIIAIDFRKAFDSINHDYIQAVLKKFHFGKNICEWVQLFFKDREGRILITDKISLEQGVPQGDIISPFIFVIAVELLLIKITKSKNIQGVHIGLLECFCSL